MIRLAQVITTFEAAFLDQYADTLLPSQRQALEALKTCRSHLSPVMQAACNDCEDVRYVPHSCGHRSCPHCQAHESQQWLERQRQKQLPAGYFLLTFTLPAELRPLAFAHQRIVYDLLIKNAWDTVNTFSHNDKVLQGTPGAIAVLHTHSRRLDYHPHVHLVMPAAALDDKNRWRTKTRYLFSHKALAKVFRAKVVSGVVAAGLTLPEDNPAQWVVDCKRTGTGESAVVYLGRYLYRGVIQEKDILSCANGHVTFRYQNAKTRKTEYRTVSGIAFLRLVLQHVLPKGFRRARHFGFLHANSKRLIQRLQLLFQWTPRPVTLSRPALRCPACGGVMHIVRTRIPSYERPFVANGRGDRVDHRERPM
jgi:hypothetical protein